MGDTDGNFVGFIVGDNEGGLVSSGIVGFHVVGLSVGSIVVGLSDGTFVGDSVGVRVGGLVATSGMNTILRSVSFEFVHGKQLNFTTCLCMNVSLFVYICYVFVGLFVYQ